MKIRLNDITEDEKCLHLAQVPFSGDVFDDKSLTGVGADFRYYRAGQTVMIHVTGTCRVRTVCYRCAAPVIAEVEVDESFPVLPDHMATEREYSHDGSLIETDDFLRETLVIDIPEKILCKPDCRGLCPVCGRDLNIGDCSCDTENND